MQTRSPRPFAAALAVVLGIAGQAFAQKSDSPFMPVGSGDTATAAAQETIEFAGVSVAGKQTLINIYDRTAKKNHWIPLKETVDGITVMTYDSVRDQVVVKVANEQKLLSLRKSTGPANAPHVVLGAPSPAMNFNVPAPQSIAMPSASPAPLPTNPPANSPETPAAPVAAAKPDEPAKPQTIARQEEEARMLVSDLLEIGMAQRKAYEEKQKQAATGEQNAAATPPPAQPTAPAPNNGS